MSAHVLLNLLKELGKNEIKCTTINFPTTNVSRFHVGFLHTCWKKIKKLLKI